MTGGRVGLVLGLLAAVVLAAYGAHSTHARRQRAAVYATTAAELDRAVHADSRFHDVTVLLTMHPRIFISAPTDLAAADRADLQRIVADARGSIPVSIDYPPSEQTRPTHTP